MRLRPETRRTMVRGPAQTILRPQAKQKKNDSLYIYLQTLMGLLDLFLDGWEVKTLKVLENVKQNHNYIKMNK